MLLRLSASACASVLAALLAGCAGNPTTAIDVSDNGVFVPTVRASVDLGYAGGPPSQPKQGHALEFGWSRGTGADTQTLSAGQLPIAFGGQTFSPPSELRNEFEFQFAELAYRFRLMPSADRPAFEAMAGIADANLDLAVSSPAKRGSEHLGNAGFVGSLGLVVPVVPSVSAHARLSAFVAPSNSDISDAVRIELHGVWALFHHAALRAGYTFWRVKSDRDNDDLSAIKLRFSGPSLGLDIAF